MSRSAKDKLIVALDVDTVGRARELLTTLQGRVGMFKVGSQLFTAAGPAIVREIVGAGERVFLDLKYHDIPNTVAGAGLLAARLGVSLFNLHAAGGSEMMRRTADAVAEVCEREGLSRPRILAVTVLTSMNPTLLAEVGVTPAVEDQVVTLARLAEARGIDGVVASPLEVGAIRSAITKKNFIIVTPGVRPANTDAEDQKRIMTPAGALSAGSDYLVVGRPIIDTSDPAEAVRRIIAEIEAA